MRAVDCGRGAVGGEGSVGGVVRGKTGAGGRGYEGFREGTSYGRTERVRVDGASTGETVEETSATITA